MKSPAFNRRLLIAFVLLAAVLTIGLSGCTSDSSNDETAAGAATGDVMIGLTDAAGDFATYTVDVVSLTLHKKNGAVVDTLPLSTRVDFAQYVDLTEFFMIRTIPGGVYDTVTMVLDYRDADIQVETEAGDAAPVAAILDGDGNAVELLSVSVQLAGDKPLVVAPGTPAYLMLDFDLNASNTVDFDISGDPVLTVDPTLIADIQPEDPKPHRIRGPLKAVDVETERFEIVVKPFRHSLSNREPRFGALTILTDDDTTYDINGQIYTGAEGLTALAGLEPFSAVVVMGDLKFRPYRFVAAEVTAGSSVPGGDQDTAAGNVASREGDVLTLRGATLKRADGRAAFNDDITVLLGEATEVRRELSEDPYTIDDISIGQRILVFGTLSSDPDNGAVIDAVDGAVTLLLTTVSGVVVSADPYSADEAPLVVDLRSIDNRDISIFDFTAAGADPAYYEIATGALDISSLTSGAPVRVMGHVAPFGANPPDFQARTIVNVEQVPSVLKVHWRPASAYAVGISFDALTLDLEGAARFHHVFQGRVITDLTTLSDAPVIVPAVGTTGFYNIHGRRGRTVFTDFAAFAADLETRLENTALIWKIEAFGEFSEPATTLTADTVHVHLF
jgi:hypothetical protein